MTAKERGVWDVIGGLFRGHIGCPTASGEISRPLGAFGDRESVFVVMKEAFQRMRPVHDSEDNCRMMVVVVTAFEQRM